MGIMEKKMETVIMGYMGSRIWGIWGSYYNIPKAIFYPIKGDSSLCLRFQAMIKQTLSHLSLRIPKQFGSRYLGVCILSSATSRGASALSDNPMTGRHCAETGDGLSILRLSSLPLPLAPLQPQ